MSVLRGVRLVCAVATACVGILAHGQDIKMEAPASGGGGVTSPVTTDPLVFDNAGNTPVQFSDGVKLSIWNSLTGTAVTATAVAPAQITTAQAGIGFTFTASAAVAGSSVAGAAGGGGFTFNLGNAARLTSGNANPGDFGLVGGTAVGTGTASRFNLTNVTQCFGTDVGFERTSSGVLAFTNCAGTLNTSLDGSAYRVAGATLVGANGFTARSSSQHAFLGNVSGIRWIGASADGLPGTATVGIFGVGTSAAVRITDGTEAGAPGAPLAAAFPSTKTSNYTVIARDSATTFNNTGAAGTVNFTLPTAAAGLWYKFCVNASQTLQITAGASTTIRIAGTASAAAGNITNNVIGSCVTLEAISTTQWFATSTPTGTWTIT